MTRTREQREQQMAVARWLTVRELAARWSLSDETVRAIPRDTLGYLEFGESKMRRYNPDDVARFEATRNPASAA